MKKIVLVVVILSFLVIPGFALAHPGKLDVRGGHICKTNCEKWGYKTGEWHQHEKATSAKNAKVQAKVKAKTVAKVSVKKVAKIKVVKQDVKTLASIDSSIITRVIDGDTVEVGGLGKIRLIGIDTPETVDPRKPVQCFGREASDKAKQMLTGKKVRLESDPTQGDRDKYGRSLRYIYLEDGTFFNKWMIENGFAHEYTYNIPYKYMDEFKAAERAAQDAGRGLWSENAC